PGLAQHADGPRRRGSRGAADQHRLVRRQLAGSLLELGERNVACVRQMPGGELGRRANVEHHGARIVDQPRGTQRVQRLPAGAARHERPQQHRAGDDGNDDQDDVVENEIQGAAPTGEKGADYRIETLGRLLRLMTYRIVLLRHGESQWNLENRFTGWTDVDLTDTGRA